MGRTKKAKVLPPEGFKRSLEFIREAGFTHIKVELEAHLKRAGVRPIRGCVECGKWIDTACINCGGRGSVAGDNLWSMECPTCAGTGRRVCSNCSDAPQLDLRINEDAEAILLCLAGEEACEKLVFCRLYNDGSVDSEFTFTVKVEDADVVPVFIEAMKELGEKFTGYFDTDNAGMHISVMTTGDPATSKISPVKYRRFKAEVNKLLPALYFLAASKPDTRPINYRHPAIRRTIKHSAIYTQAHHLIEFRIFDTCYNSPEHFAHNVEVIAKSLLFYHTSQKVDMPVQKFMMPFNPNVGIKLHEWFNKPEQLRCLKTGLKYLLPRGLSLNDVARKRGVSSTLAKMAEDNRKRKSKTDRLYSEYVRTRKKRGIKPLSKTAFLRKKRMGLYSRSALLELERAGDERSTPIRNF